MITNVNPSHSLKLTGIRQETVDEAQPLPHVWLNFTKWLIGHELIAVNEQRSGQLDELVGRANFAFVTCGNWASDRN